MIPVYNFESLGYSSYVNQGVIVTPFFDEKICDEISNQAEEFWKEQKYDRLSCWGGGSDRPKSLKHAMGISYASNDLWLESLGNGYSDLFYRTCKESAEKEMKKYFSQFFISRFYTENEKGDKWCKPWIMRYSPKINKDLEVHLDFSTFTISVALNDDFEGGELYFPNQGGYCPKVPKGYAVIFPGLITHPHGVFPMRKGVRLSLISMMYGVDLSARNIDSLGDHVQVYEALKGQI